MPEPEYKTFRVLNTNKVRVFITQGRIEAECRKCGLINIKVFESVLTSNPELVE